MPMRVRFGGLPAVCVVLVLVLVIGTPVLAKKANLRPEQLIASSELIVTGKVESHRDEVRSEYGGKKRFVFLTVNVESVDKGADLVKPGDKVQAEFWMAAEESDAEGDSGHSGIPGDGGRAKFFLASRSGESWKVIHPNGFERLDDTPWLKYSLAPANSLNLPLVVGLAVGGLAVVAMLVWMVRRRRNGPGAI